MTNHEAPYCAVGAAAHKISALVQKGTYLCNLKNVMIDAAVH